MAEARDYLRQIAGVRQSFWNAPSTAKPVEIPRWRPTSRYRAMSLRRMSLMWWVT